MFVMDVPAMYAPVVIAQAPKTQPEASPVAGSRAVVERTIGVCQLMENPPIPPETAANSISPVTAAWGYLQTVEKVAANKLTDDMFNSAKTTLLDGAKHGKLEGGDDYFYYHPTPDYFGTDRATVLVEMGNYKVKVVVHIKVLAPTEGNDYQNKQLCPNGRRWKISLNPEDPFAPTYSFTTPLLWTSGASGYAAVSYGLANFNLNFADLPGGAVGETTSQSITLDTTAAGHGWYVDPTPLDNSDDYLPASNPDVWQAKAGTDAAGKMDLLSVLLHEYGHALGLDHSGDSGDFMAATLKPGERRRAVAHERAGGAAQGGRRRQSNARHTEPARALRAAGRAAQPAANGSEFVAQGVTHATHADGSRSYMVDLAGMARNADGSVAVNLSFDLIGFGANGSHVTVSDVGLYGQPQAADAVASGAEDAVLTIPALTNDENANLPGLAPVVVANAGGSYR